MAKKDFYETLGAQRGASADELKKAYRKLAMQYHPDKNPGDAASEAKFKEINEAYDILKDEQKRAAYDRMGHAAFEGGMGRGGPGGMGGGFGGNAQGFDFSGSFSDIFEDLFGGVAGGGRGAAQNSRGADLRYNLDITLNDAFRGKQQTISITTSVECDNCHGSGSEKNSKPETCPTCKGNGKIRAQQGFFTVERSCHTCQGTGKIVKDPCKQCAGSGRTRREKSLMVNIPAGVEDGTRIRLTGEGEAGMRGGTSGDLYIFLTVTPHPFFKREGSNLHCRVPIKFTTASLGGSVEVPTVDGGKVKVTVPEGTQTGHQFRLKGKGMSVMRSTTRGDMYVHVTVETPVKLNKKQKDLLRELDKDTGTSPESEGFFAKVKDFWEDLKD